MKELLFSDLSRFSHKSIKICLGKIEFPRKRARFSVVPVPFLFQIGQLKHENNIFSFGPCKNSNSSTTMPQLFPLLAIISMFLVTSKMKTCPILHFQTSLVGVIVTVWIFLKFARKTGEFSDFHKFCMVKTIPDMFVCGAFLFWVVPVTALSLTYEQVPYLPNVLIGQTASGGAYILGEQRQCST